MSKTEGVLFSPVGRKIPGGHQIHQAKASFGYPARLEAFADGNTDFSVTHIHHTL